MTIQPNPRLTCFLLPLLAAAAHADVRLPRVFGDHMVLQRESEVAVWGWAEPGEHVRVRGTWSEDHESLVQAGSDGRWSTTIPTGVAGGPYRLIVQGNDRLVLEDVLLGEVWICSGQSNMEWPLSASDDAQAEIAAANHPRLRLFDVPNRVAVAPEDDLAGGEWRPCSPETVSSFSAVGYFFGRELQAELDVPVGLVAPNWGGTVSEAWTSAETLARFEEFAPALARLRQAASGDLAEPSLAELQANWWRNLDAKDPGVTGKWMDAGTVEAGWNAAAIPGRFTDLGLANFDGTVWFRREVELPAEWAGRELVLEIGPVDDLDRTYFNGALVGETVVMGRWNQPRSYRIPAGGARAGANVLAVCAIDTGGEGTLGMAGNVKPPMRLYPADGDSAASVRLEGDWSLRPGVPSSDLGAYPTNNWLHANFPTALHNGMIAPLVPFGIRGAIWYQGESNRARAAQYRRLFPALIGDWRARWGRGDFPFYFVQIAPYRYGGDGGEAAELREAQAFALGAPHTGMAVTMDIGDPADIHPRNKRDVGRRLALWALARDYGRDVVPSGPLFGGMVVVGDAAHLTFRYGEGLAAGEGGPTHFTIAGEDRVFHPATARIVGDRVIVRADAVAKPVAVRYAWGAADTPDLRNGAGLPASSFRTDDWPPVSASR